MGFRDTFLLLLKPENDPHYVNPYQYGGNFFDRLYLHSQNFTYKWRKPLIAFGVLSVSVFAFAIFVMMIKFTVDGSHLNRSSLDFALYKNTFYNSCSSSTSGQCELRNRQSMSALNGTYIYYWTYGVSEKDFCSCFPGVKVIPSSPRQSAFGYNGLEEWLSQTITLATGLWTFLQMFLMREPHRENLNEDTKISKFTYALFVYDVVQFVMWWVAFGLLASKPASQSPVAIMSWITPWRYMFSMAAPPLINRLGKRPDRRPTLIYVIGFIALVQWISSASIIGISHTLGLSTVRSDPSYVRYDFKEALFDDAPGSTSCSTDDIKQLIGLFTSPSGGGGHYSSTSVAYIISFVANSIAAFIGTWRFFRSSDPRSRGFGVTIFVLAFADYIIMAVALSPASQASSTILFHERCNALHITLSTNKGYIDVSGYARGWRAAKGWFSV